MDSRAEGSWNLVTMKMFDEQNEGFPAELLRSSTVLNYPNFSLMEKIPGAHTRLI